MNLIRGRGVRHWQQFSVKRKNNHSKLKRIISLPFLSSHNRQQFNDKNNRPNRTIADILLRWRWMFMALFGLAVIVFEFNEHTERQPAQLAQLSADREFVIEVFLYGVILPLVGGLVLSMLNYFKLTKDHTEYRLDRQHELCQQLANSVGWNELFSTMVKFPRTFIPVEGAVLLTNDTFDSSRWRLVAEWWQGRSRPSGITSHDLKLDACRHCANRSLSGVHPILPQSSLRSMANAVQINGYCQPLSHHNQLIAVTRIFLPPTEPLTDHQADLLTGLAPIITIAILLTRARQIAINKVQMSEIERHRIANDLDNSLGKNLAYFQLGLERLAPQGASQKNKKFRQELKLLQEVVDEAFEQMQVILIDLRGSDVIHLSTKLLGQAQSIGEHANFAVEFNNKGLSRRLPPLIQQQTLYLFQEALTNVALHAQASHVKIDLSWATDVLTITLVDNGQGFSPDAIQTDRHMGLTSMQEWAAKMDGHLTVNSQPNNGTQITFRLPLTNNANIDG